MLVRGERHTNIFKRVSFHACFDCAFSTYSNNNNKTQHGALAHLSKQKYNLCSSPLAQGTFSLFSGDQNLCFIMSSLEIYLRSARKGIHPPILKAEQKT